MVHWYYFHKSMTAMSILTLYTIHVSSIYCARWLQLYIGVLGAWGLVHVEVAFQDPFLEMIRPFGRLWHLLDWLLGS